MNRLILLCSLLLSVVQPVLAKDYKIGLSVWSDYPDSVSGFKQALAEHGFKEGINVEYLLRNAHANADKQTKIAEEFKNAKLDLVYSLTTPGTIIIKRALDSAIPIVFSIVTYPADAGLIESFDYSGNNLVGTSNFVPLRHYIQLLSTLVPKTKTVAIFHRKGEPNSKMQTINLARLLRRQGIEVLIRQPQNIQQVTQMAQALVGKANVFVTTTDTLMQSGGEKALIDVSKQYNIPILSSNKQGIVQGATFGPVADFFILGKMSGNMAAQILSGQSAPSKLQSKYQNPPTILINAKRAKALNITIPDTLKGVVYVE
ncbi:MAG: ABC transporter substrate-binding protein [Algicola sp.]|nr:ABC transporter substrate-binding protein [Algicola sp.]